MIQHNSHTRGTRGPAARWALWRFRWPWLPGMLIIATTGTVVVGLLLSVYLSYDRASAYRQGLKDGSLLTTAAAAEATCNLFDSNGHAVASASAYVTTASGPYVVAARGCQPQAVALWVTLNPGAPSVWIPGRITRDLRDPASHYLRWSASPTDKPAIEAFAGPDVTSLRWPAPTSRQREGVILVIAAAALCLTIAWLASKRRPSPRGPLLSPRRRRWLRRT